MRTIFPEDYRNYQVEARDETFGHFEDGKDSALVVMPTGTGKTVLGGMCAEYALEHHGRRTLFIAHREVLINQAYRTLCAFGLDTAIEMGAQNAQEVAAVCGHADVVAASIQTMQDDRLMRWAVDHFGLIIVDETHRILANSYTKMLNWFSGHWLMGITATPKRGDGRNLGSRFQVKSYELSLRRAIAERWLVKIITRQCPIEIDLRGIKLHGGDFAVGELEERIGPQIEMLARAFRKEIGRRKAIAFLPDVGSSMAFAQVMSDLGTPARYVAGTGGAFGMSRSEKNVNLEAFDANEYQVIVCNELLTEGWDHKPIEAVGILCPTLQQYRYAQRVGRGTRPCPEIGKTDVLVVDFDWKTDPEAKDLCCSVDLFDDGMLNEDVYAEAKRLAKERTSEGKDVDAEEVIEQAEQNVRTRQRFLVKLTGREAEYAALDYDPVGVAQILDVPLKRKYDLDKSGRNPATPGQINYLTSLGVQVPHGLSKWGAIKMLDKITKRREQGLASFKQVKALLESGVNPDLARSMKRGEALEAIRALEPTKPKQQGSLFS